MTESLPRRPRADSLVAFAKTTMRNLSILVLVAAPLLAACHSKKDSASAANADTANSAPSPPARTSSAATTSAAPKPSASASAVTAATGTSPSAADKKAWRDSALMSLGGMRRGAHQAYEHEQPVSVSNKNGDYRLCTSALPVPSSLPKGTSYEPSTEAGQDFLSGDRKDGWKCLGFSITRPIRCQLSYVAGGPYKSEKVGNKAAPKPDDKGKPATGYEVSAECDFDGNGKTSLYAITGAVDPKTKQLKWNRKIFKHNDGE